jgi:hypothetical protein
VKDLCAGIDATVAKRGVFSLCFHPHGWISSDQIVQVIDHVVENHGRTVKFLTFAEVQECLDKNLLDGYPLRDAMGQDNGVRILDVDGDGYMDVCIGKDGNRKTRIWRADSRTWGTVGFPVAMQTTNEAGQSYDSGVRFGVLQADGSASLLVHNDRLAGVWHFDRDRWVQDSTGLRDLLVNQAVFTQVKQRDQGVRFRDLDADGICELMVSSPTRQAIFARGQEAWTLLPFTTPVGIFIVDDQGRDAGLRFVDFDEDGHDDLVFSDARRCAAYAFEGIRSGWSRKIFDMPRTGTADELPMIVRADGTDNGAWFRFGHMWVQNEDTGGRLPDHVDRRSFKNFSTSEK